MSGPLEGVRVVDLTTMVAGPVAAMMLADQGADVVKVESPAGDLMRRFAFGRNGISASFLSCNRNKRSIAIDNMRRQFARTLNLDAVIENSNMNIIFDAVVTVKNRIGNNFVQGLWWIVNLFQTTGAHLRNFFGYLLSELHCTFDLVI